MADISKLFAAASEIWVPNCLWQGQLIPKATKMLTLKLSSDREPARNRYTPAFAGMNLHQPVRAYDAFARVAFG
ncbi:MAG: hypothetical protein QM760_20210 [Nibricoccus sp.]